MANGDGESLSEAFGFFANQMENAVDATTSAVSDSIQSTKSFLGDKLTFTDSDQSLGEVLRTSLMDFKDFMGDKFGSLIENVKGLAGSIAGKIGGVLEGAPIFDTLSGMIPSLSSAASGLAGLAGGFGISKLFSGMSMPGSLSGLLSTLVNLGGWALGGGVLRDLILGEGDVAGFLGFILDELGVDWLVEQVFGLEEGSVDLSRLFERRFEAGAEGFQAALHSAATSLIKGMTFGATSVIEFVSKMFGINVDLDSKKLANQYIKRFNQGVQGFEAMVRTVSNKFTSTVSSVFDSVTSWFDKNILVGSLSKFKKRMDIQIDNVVGAFKSGWKSVDKWVTKFWKGLKSGWNNLDTHLTNLWQGVKSQWSNLKSGFSTLVNTVKNTGPWLRDIILNYANELTGGTLGITDKTFFARRFKRQMQGPEGKVASDLVSVLKSASGAGLSEGMLKSMVKTAANTTGLDVSKIQDLSGLSDLKIDQKRAAGGPINEPIVGLGLNSGETYSFGEGGMKEYVVPLEGGQGSSSGSQEPVTVNEQKGVRNSLENNFNKNNQKLDQVIEKLTVIAEKVGLSVNGSTELGQIGNDRDVPLELLAKGAY